MSKSKIAKILAEQNRSIIPLLPNDKKPKGKWDKFQKERMTPDQAFNHFEANPNDNIGMVTGKISGISVIDVDGEEGVHSLKESGIELPDTAVVKTPKGWHYYYKYNPELKQGANRLNKVDIRNDGGYVVVPPSEINGVHYKNKGNGHKYIEEFNIDIPKEFKGVYTEPSVKDKSSTQEKPQWVADALANGVSSGRRNDVATRLAGYFHSKGIAQDIIFTMLQEFADKCTPRILPHELQTIVSSIQRYSQTNILSYQGNVVPPPLMDASNDRIRNFIWTEWGLKVLADSIKKTSRGIECKLNVSSTEQGHMYMGRLNLHSASQKQQFVRDLKNRAEYDWSGIINHIAKLIEDSIDTPEDIVDLAKVKERKDDPFLIYPFMRKSNPVILYGDGGEGKSTLAVAVGLSIATGKNFIPTFEVNDIGNVMYLDWEQEAEDVADVMKKMCLGLGIEVPSESFLYRRMVGSLSDHVEGIHRDIIANDIKMIIIDSLVASSGGDVNDSETARILFNIVRGFKVSAIIITHISKADEGKPFGSIFFWNYARNVWQLAKSQDTGVYTSVIGLFHKKSNRNMLSTPLGLEVEFTNQSIKYSTADLQDEPELSGRTTIADQISGLLRNAPDGMVASEIADELEKNEGAIRKELNRKSKGRDIRFENIRGKWILASRQEEEMPRKDKGVHYEENPPPLGGDVSSTSKEVFNKDEANEKLKKILGEDNER
tara:strand:- start:879 stop:3029 length:2151 start_codon:yes stop_codon:yes gene_type:complete